MGSGGQRLDALEGLRGVAALWVLAFHAWTFTSGPETGGAWHVVAGAGWLGVDVFFVLSGFLLARQRLLADGPAGGERAYLIGRALRILPAYYVQLAVLLAAGALTSRWPAWSAPDATAVLAHALLAVNAWPLVGVHLGPWWSLPVEFGFYLLLPALAPLLRSPARLFALLLASAALSMAWRAGVLAEVGTAAARYAWVEQLPARLVQFVLGMGLAHFLVTRHSGLGPRWAAGCALAGLVALMGLNALAGGTAPYVHGAPLGVLSLAWPLLTGLAAAGVVVGGIGAGPWHPLRARPVVALGTVSYGIYLWHYAVMGAWVGWVGLNAVREDVPRFLAGTVVLTLLLSTLSWWGVERPALAWSARLRASLAKGPSDVRDQRPRQLRRTPRQDRHPRDQGRAHPRRR